MNINDVFNVDLTGCFTSSEIITNVSLALELPNAKEKKINLSIRDVQAYDPEPKPVELDEEGNPIVPEKKERPRKKDRADRPNKGEKRAKKDGEEEIVADKASSMGTSIGDILAAKLQPAIEVETVSDNAETNE